MEAYDMPGTSLGKAFFDAWAPEYTKNHDKSITAETRRQRLRKSIPAGHVSKNGALILKIASAIILTRDDKALEALNNQALCLRFWRFWQPKRRKIWHCLW
jgi:hypothetical protein